MIFHVYRSQKKILAEDGFNNFLARVVMNEGEAELTELSSHEYENELISTKSETSHYYFKADSLSQLSQMIRTSWGMKTYEDRGEVALILRMAATVFGAAPAPKVEKKKRASKPRTPKVEAQPPQIATFEAIEEPSEEEIKESVDHQINELELTLNSSSTDNPLWGCF